MNQVETLATTGELGTLAAVELRGTWPHEASTFTPWLAQEKNLARLAQELGLELELEGVEVPVGPYSADILAKDVGSGDYVVIENQLEKTNHDHLGKIITYASVLDVPERIDMATVYVQPEVGLRLLPEFEQKQIEEIWINPGADSPELIADARRRKLNIIVACSLVGAGQDPSAF